MNFTNFLIIPILQKPPDDCLEQLQKNDTYKCFSALTTNSPSKKLENCFFPTGFSLTDTDDSQDSKGRQETIFYFTLPLPSAHEHSEIYLQLCMWWLSRIFNRNSCAYQTATRWDLPPYWITILLIDDVTLSFCLRDDLILAFLLQQFETGNRWIWTRSTITLILQANRLTKCAFRVFWCHSWKLKVFLITFDFELILRSGVMQVVFINECKSCEISNQMFFNVMFSFSKTKDKLVMTKIL